LFFGRGRGIGEDFGGLRWIKDWGFKRSLVKILVGYALIFDLTFEIMSDRHLTHPTKYRLYSFSR